MPSGILPLFNLNYIFSVLHVTVCIDSNIVHYIMYVKF